MELILKYFPNLTDIQIKQFTDLFTIYQEWNAKINVISRKDIDELYTRHVLHSLAIAKIQPFNKDATVMDVGTGGGFPLIPLAILFPETSFYGIDIIAKKIKVVNEVINAIGLTNVTAEQIRAENVHEKFDFVVSRAVTNMPDFVKWIKGKIKKKSKHDFQNGILYLKGGDLTEELKNFKSTKQYNISKFFEEEFFETKKVVYLPL